MVMSRSQLDESSKKSRVASRLGWHRCGAVCLAELWESELPHFASFEPFLSVCVLSFDFRVLSTYQKRDRELGGALFMLDIYVGYIYVGYKCRISWIYRQILLLVATVQLSMITMIIVQLKMIVRNDLNILSSSFSSFSSSSSSSSHVISAPPLSKWNFSTKFCTVIDSNSLHSYHRSDIGVPKRLFAQARYEDDDDDDGPAADPQLEGGMPLPIRWVHDGENKALL